VFKNKEGKIRSGWKIVSVTLMIFVAIMLISMIIGFVVNVIFITSDGTNLDSITLARKTKQVQTNLQLTLLFIQELVMIIAPMIAWKYVIKRPLSNMGLSPIKINIKELYVGLLFGAVSMSIVFFILIVSGNAVVKSWTPHFSLDTLIYLSLFIFVGFAEEIYGRGFVMSALRQTRSVPVVVIVSSIIFALLHSANSGIGMVPYVNLVLVGILLSYIYIKSGNIWMCIGFHITWNYFQGNVFGFLVSGTETKGIITTTYEQNNIINGGAFGPEGGFIVTAVILVSFLFVRLYYKNSNFDFLATEDIPIQNIETYDNNNNSTLAL